jgi:predicted site-specific integrase-resolvase
MLQPDEAAVTAGVSVRTVNRWVEAETVHFNETANGLLLICANSVGSF